MYKKILRVALGLILLITPLCHAVELQTPCTPDNTTIAFDIDNVLLERNIASILWTYRWDVAKSIINLPLIYNVACLLYHSAPGRAYSELFKVKAPRLNEMAEHIILDKKPLEGMEALVDQLHGHNYKLTLASNMSTQDVTFYQQKFPLLFNKFCYAKTVPYNTNNKAIGPKKPSLEYFKQLKEELALQALAKKNILFIDDRTDNVAASAAEGFNGIHFKNAAQLQKRLQALAILQQIQPTHA